MLKVGDAILDSVPAIESHIVDYFSSLDSLNSSSVDNGLVEQVIPSLVSSDDNSMLTNLPSMEEVRNAVFSMNNNSAPDPDGFGSCFYQSFWDLVGYDVFKSVLQFFEQGWLPPNLNSNIVVLIPKENGAERIGQYRPIALANFQFKIITIVLAGRLAIIAPSIVSDQQRGFIRGRNISDCICKASGAVNMLCLVIGPLEEIWQSNLI